MVYGHSSGLLPQEAPAMTAAKRELFFSFLSFLCTIWHGQGLADARRHAC